ncbi:MAG: hypothetical protein KC457_00880 [Myxococcales bacterium]|nr:hypothetical protein [Myxococcales bacterium]
MMVVQKNLIGTFVGKAVELAYPGEFTEALVWAEGNDPAGRRWITMRVLSTPTDGPPEQQEIDIPAQGLEPAQHLTYLRETGEAQVELEVSLLRDPAVPEEVADAEAVLRKVTRFMYSDPALEVLDPRLGVGLRRIGDPQNRDRLVRSSQWESRAAVTLVFVWAAVELLEATPIERFVASGTINVDGQGPDLDLDLDTGA